MSNNFLCPYLVHLIELHMLIYQYLVNQVNYIHYFLCVYLILLNQIKFLFFVVGVNRIAAAHDYNNPKSGWVMQKLGMQYEGTLRMGDRNKTGICDASYYGILRGERWSAAAVHSRSIPSKLAFNKQVWAAGSFPFSRRLNSYWMEIWNPCHSMAWTAIRGGGHSLRLYFTWFFRFLPSFKLSVSYQILFSRSIAKSIANCITI